MLAAGPAALVLQLVTPPVPAPVVQASATDPMASARAAVGAFAQDFVVTWLTTPSGREADLEPFVATAAAVTLPQQPWTVDEAAVSGVVETEHRLWSATVAVTVAEPAPRPPRDEEATETAGPVSVRRYFQVPVRHTEEGGLRAQALPSPVPGPGVADPMPMAYDASIASSEPIVAAAGEFLGALLTGAGDVGRYVTPGATITALTPPPYVSVRLDGVLVDREPPVEGEPLGDGERRHLLVTATAASGVRRAVAVQYALTVTARDGRWEVSSIDPAPLVSTPPQDDGTPDSETPVPDDSTG